MRIKKVAIDNGAMTYNEFCKQENDDSYDYMPALKTFYVNVKEGLDNEDAKTCGLCIKCTRRAIQCRLSLWIICLKTY